jgi:hypothetical protein
VAANAIGVLGRAACSAQDAVLGVLGPEDLFTLSMLEPALHAAGVAVITEPAQTAGTAQQTSETPPTRGTLALPRAVAVILSSRWSRQRINAASLIMNRPMFGSKFVGSVAASSSKSNQRTARNSSAS